MIRRPPTPTLTDTRFPYTTLFRLPVAPRDVAYEEHSLGTHTLSSLRTPPWTCPSSFNSITNRSAQTGVGVQSGHDHVDDEQIEQHRDESCDVYPSGFGLAPTCGRSGVEVGGVNHPGDKRHRLFGIPPPEPTPGCLRPDRAEDDSDTKEREADDDGSVGQPVECLGVGQTTSHRTYRPAALRAGGLSDP